jgi:nucleotide-binding universal stress UspA family protein
MLLRADCVEIVTVIGEKDLSRMAPGADLASYLAAHGVVSCGFDTLVAIGGKADERLAERVEEMSPGLVIMGAFVHSRFREAILGGVTRTFLERPLVPVLLSH